MPFIWGLLVGLVVGINLGVILHAVVVYLKNRKIFIDCKKDYENY